MKRMFDVLTALMAFVALAVPMILVTLAIKLTSRGPAIFWSRRVGRNNHIFLMPKFRTMRVDTPQVATHLLADSRRWITPVGYFLRKTSLDELPQLLSILRGDMSFVGPRPALFNQDDLIALRTERGVQCLRPGLTGWAQINGRDELEIPVKVEFDAYYLHHQSFLFDLRILLLTFVKVLRREGVKQADDTSNKMSNIVGGATDVEPQRRKVVVIGAGGHAKVVISSLQASEIKVDCVYDDNPATWGSDVSGIPVRGPLKMLLNSDRDVTAVIAIGKNEIRWQLAAQLKLEWLTVVHPRAFVDSAAKLGPGTVVLAGAVIQPDAVVGNHAIVNTGVTIDHDCHVGDFVSLAPGSHLAGGVTVGDRTMIGTGCSVIPQIAIASNCTIGAGTVVVRDIPSGCTVVDQPAQMIRYPQELENLRKSA